MGVFLTLNLVDFAYFADFILHVAEILEMCDFKLLVFPAKSLQTCHMCVQYFISNSLSLRKSQV